MSHPTNPKFRVPDQLLMPWSPRYTVSTSRVAEMLDCSVDTVIRLIESGKIQAYRLRPTPGCPYRVNYDSVLAYITQLHEEYGLEKRFE